MNNKVSDLLEVNFPEPNHSNFNLGRKNVFTADVGYLYPCYVEEVLPNSYKRLDVEALVQCNATVAPVMGSFTTKIDAYFIPLRIYHEHLLNNDRAIDYNDDFQLHYFPWLDVSTGLAFSNSDRGLEVAPGSLLEYLGMFPAGWNNTSWAANTNAPAINAYPFIGYFDIYRNYYANPHDPIIPFRVYNTPDDTPWLPTADGRDGYVQLQDFDDFINTIRQNSVTFSGGTYRPQRVNVFNTFVNRMTLVYPRPTADGGVLTLSRQIPLFQGSFFSANPVPEAPGSVPAANQVTSNGLHYGLLRRTYKDDYFNARFSNEFIDYVKSTARVVISDNSFDITQLRLKNRLAKYIDKLGFSDSRFGTWLKVHFGTKLNDRADIPQFLGSITSTLAFDDIISNAQTGSGDVITSNEALGSRAGLGAGYIKNDGAFVEFNAVEPGYLMCLFSIIPNVSYSQGIRKLYLKNRFSDFYTPEFDAVGYQDLHAVEMSAIGYTLGTGYSSLGGPLNFEEYNEVVGQHPSWLEYMTAIDEVHGLATKRTEYGYWTLTRPFDPNGYVNFGTTVSSTANSWDRSTYIKPEYFNNIFAVNRSTDNFQVQIRWYDKTKQPMSKQVLPRL